MMPSVWSLEGKPEALAFEGRLVLSRVGRFCVPHLGQNGRQHTSEKLGPDFRISIVEP